MRNNPRIDDVLAELAGMYGLTTVYGRCTDCTEGVRPSVWDGVRRVIAVGGRTLSVYGGL